MTGDTFLLDANIFIEAHRRYYGLDLCPGFWESLRHFARRARVLSIDRVYRELEDGSSRFASAGSGRSRARTQVLIRAGDQTTALSTPLVKMSPKVDISSLLSLSATPDPTATPNALSRRIAMTGEIPDRAIDDVRQLFAADTEPPGGLRDGQSQWFKAVVSYR